MRLNAEGVVCRGGGVGGDGGDGRVNVLLPPVRRNVTSLGLCILRKKAFDIPCRCLKNPHKQTKRQSNKLFILQLNDDFIVFFVLFFFFSIGTTVLFVHTSCLWF